MEKTVTQLKQAVEETLPVLKVQPALKINFTPMAEVTNLTVPTTAAAYYLDRKPETLRQWAHYKNGPILPLRIHGRLAWNIAEIRTLLNGGA